MSAGIHSVLWLGPVFWWRQWRYENSLVGLNSYAGEALADRTTSQLDHRIGVQVIPNRARAGMNRERLRAIVPDCAVQLDFRGRLRVTTLATAL